jgi:hypothetical protein
LGSDEAACSNLGTDSFCDSASDTFIFARVAGDWPRPVECQSSKVSQQRQHEFESLTVQSIAVRKKQGVESGLGELIILFCRCCNYARTGKSGVARGFMVVGSFILRLGEVLLHRLRVGPGARSGSHEF